MFFSSKSDAPALAEIEVESLSGALATAGAQAFLFDVREADEFREVRATPAKHLALSAIEGGERPNVDKQATIYLMCLSGRRSQAAAKILRDAGFTSVTNVKGGIKAWLAAALAVERG